jgi:hypothetical protein
MMKLSLVAAAVLLCSGLTSCATEREPEFGSSVRHMMTGQKYDPAAPAPTTSGVDGQKAAQAVTTYRSGKEKDGGAAGTPMVLLPTQQ